MIANKKLFFKTPFCGPYNTQLKSFNNLTTINPNNITNNSIKIGYPCVLRKQFGNNPYFSKKI